ncbi:MAG TPA: acyltransferase [Sedimenticola sp.]|nr:acyltransferase [Sedimenticola sp.]
MADAPASDRSQPRPLDGVVAFREAARELAEQARRTLDILTLDLEAPLYDQTPFLAAVKQLALRGNLGRIRVLLLDNERVRQHGHRLLELATRLPSRIEIRRPPPEHADHPENFLVADRRGYLHRHRGNGYAGETHPDYRLRATRLARVFDEIWERSEQDSTLRRLHL